MRAPDVEAEFTMLATSQGGRQGPAFSGYRPAHKVRDDYLTSGEHQYLDGEQVSPRQTARCTITFITPEVYPQCLWVGRVLDVQEGSRLVGHVRITRVFNPVLERPA